MNLTDIKRYMQYAWDHKTMVYTYVLLRLAMVSPFVGLNAFLHELRGVTIGHHVKIAHDVLIDPVEPKSITIEDYVTISPRVTIYAHTNPTLPLYEYMGPRTVEPVHIKKGAWIGTGAIILPGVTIGEYSVVGAGSVVVKDIPGHTLAVGVPANPVRTLHKKFKIPEKATKGRVLVLDE
ncbi:MAG: acyltransferase [Candidatus Methanofastidiosia archaeon]|jgi:acetyltransferase-like isoleucine patch superfamily enzyme